MAYLFETAQDDGIFTARVGGDRHKQLADNFAELWEFWTGVAADMKRRRLRKLLAVVSARGSLRSLDVRTFYRRLGEMGFMADMRLAVVVDVSEHDRPVLQLGVSGAAQDGWTIRLFRSESDARAWLTSDSGD